MLLEIFRKNKSPTSGYGRRCAVRLNPIVGVIQKEG